jgi:hypothetical protein
MDINEIRDAICDNLSSVDGHSLWDDILEGTSPANYGFEVECVSVERNDIWVDVPNRTFTFKNLHLTFSARLGGSNLNNGYDEEFHFKLSGSGSFVFTTGSQSIEVEHVSIGEDEDLDLYGDSASRVNQVDFPEE